MKQGPNVRKLIAHKMSLLMVPPGIGNKAFSHAMGELTKPGNLVEIAKEATRWVEAALAAVKAAPDCPFGNDDEAIAKEILDRVAAIEKQRKMP